MKPFFSLFVCVLCMAIGVRLFFKDKVSLPDHLINHSVSFIPNFLTEREGKELRAALKEIGRFPTNLADTSFYKTKYEHIGEGVPFDGAQCPNPLLVPSKNREMCVLPGRVDVGRHFLLHGGYEGVKEKYDTSISRLLSFGHYAFEISSVPIMEELFHSQKFTEAAQQVCPPDQQIVDPFQFNYILQIPSQSVAMHLDGEYFWGADRFSFPQWLLTVMKFSGLFEEKFINQIQVVAYLHEWEDPVRKGNFVYFNENGAPSLIPPTPLAASIVDGSKVVHAATIYEGKPDSKMPRLDRNKPNILTRMGKDGGDDELWGVFDGESVVYNMTFDEIRISLVYRARCFASEEEKDKFYHQEENMSLEYILSTLKEDLKKKNIKIPEGDFDFALLLLDTYIRYPLPPVFFPYNYCALPKMVPSLGPLIDLIC